MTSRLCSLSLLALVGAAGAASRDGSVHGEEYAQRLADPALLERVTSGEPLAFVALPYASDALEPAVDERTMRIHHGVHYKGYVTKFNAALGEALRNESGAPTLAAASASALGFNGGGALNHELFFSVLAPANSSEMSPWLLRAVERSFGGAARLEEEMLAKGTGVQGSGWVWLGVLPSPSGTVELFVETTANQETLAGKRAGATAVLGLDVWEHAYYLKYQYRRGDYLAAIWGVVDWTAVEHRLRAAAPTA